MKSIEALLAPASVAVIGASREPKSVGHTLLSNLIGGGYGGAIYPVNPHADTILDRPCYHDVSSLPGIPDLAVIVVPAKIVPNVLKDCGTKGIKAAIIISSGFAETGADGAVLQHEITEIARTTGITVLGPNCLGIINPGVRLNASFAMVSPIPGPIAFVSQSGAICASMIDYANTMRIGFSKFVSIGNKADIDEIDLLEYLADDADTKVICLYAEQLADAQRFIRTVRKLGDGPQPKPVIVLKAGATDAGATAARSHTGALSGHAATYSALFAQANATQVDGVEDLLTTAACFAYNGLPDGRRTAIVTNAGGPGIIATDTAVTHGLTLAAYTDGTKTVLADIVGGNGHAGNPMDVLGDADASRYAKAMAAVSADPGVDSLAVILTPQSTTEIMDTAKAVISLRETSPKPIAVSFMGSSTVETAVGLLRERHIPVFPYPEDGIRTLAHLSAFSERRGRPETPPVDFLQVAVDSRLLQRLADKQPLMSDEAAELIAAYGVRTPATYRYRDGDTQVPESLTAASYALKILSPQILHKTDAGGVALNVPRDTVIAACRDMMVAVAAAVPGAVLEGVQVSEMAQTANAAELIMGFSREPGLGPVLMVGAGGVLVELLKDVRFRFLPADEGEIREAVSELRLSKLLAGYRGGKPFDIDSIVATAMKLTALCLAHPEIAECDINPLVVYPRDSGLPPVALDVRFKPAA